MNWPCQNRNNYICKTNSACPAKEHGLCGECVARFSSTCYDWYEKCDKCYLCRYMTIIHGDGVNWNGLINFMTCMKIIGILKSKGYDPKSHIGDGCFKEVFLVTNNKTNFAAKLSYGERSLKDHTRELEIQNEFGDLAVQAIDSFTVNDKDGKPIALVEIQDEVEVFEDRYERYEKEKSRSEQLLLVNEFKRFQSDVEKEGWVVRDLCFEKRNAGYHNGKLKLIDLGVAQKK